MPKNTNVYNDDSISSLKGAERVRKRPAVIFGSSGLDGCEHAIFEVVSNSIDEARGGNGDRIVVTKYKDGSFSVEDFGRGIPIGYNKGEERYNWELLFAELYAGGKYNDEGYEFSLGLNGLGLASTQYASEWMKADIWRGDGKKYHLDFEKGENVGGLQEEPTRFKRTGSLIRWKPDLDVFSDINVPSEYFHDMLKRQAIANAGIHMQFVDETAPDGSTTTEFFYEGGIEEYVEEFAGSDALTPVACFAGSAKGRDSKERPEYKVQMQVAFCFSNKVQLLEYYHNSSFLEHGGTPDRATKLAFQHAIDTYLRNKGMYKKGESKISFTDVEDCLVYVYNGLSTLADFSNQTKKSLDSKFVGQALNEFLKQSLEVYFIEKPEEAQKLAQQVLVNKQSRERAEKTRQSLKKTISSQMDIANRVQKFVDCRSKDPARREIYIVEGDSALGAVKTSRDSEYQAIMPIRGKILNCLKADYGRIFKSDIITDLIKVLGCGVELTGGKSRKDLATFDLNSLRWNKVILCTDADVDGFQIRTLLLTMIHRLVPTLIEEGYVYIAETPLFEVSTRDKTYFAYSDNEYNEILKKVEGKKFTVQRSKGLGENDPEMMWLTTMNPETRRLVKVTPEEAQRTQDMFDMLLGDNLAGRKEHIANHGYMYLDDLDVS